MCVISDNLPNPPKGHHYELEKVSALVTQVWLVRNEPSQLLEREVRTIYCFIKGSKNLKVHQPKNSKNMYVKSFCDITELSSQPPYSLFIPKVTKLFD